MSEPLDPRIETSHLSVESIIRTYANRLIEQESRSMTAEIIEERDILLAWWAEREAALLAAQERVAALEGALRAVADYEPDYHDVPEVPSHADCAECAKWVGHPVQRGLCDAGYREIDRRNAARTSIDSAQHYHMRDLARAALPATETPERETAWLIERGQSMKQAPTVWWTGERGYSGMAHWTTDALKAKRFTTKAEAESVIEANSHPMPSNDFAVYGIATEHIFITRATETPG